MSDFIVDNQTIKDLQLFSESEECVFDYYDFTESNRGKEYLIMMLENPLGDKDKIIERIEAIEFIGKLPAFLPIKKDELEFIEYYFSNVSLPMRRNSVDILWEHLKNKIFPKNCYYVSERAVCYLMRNLKVLREFFDEIPDNTSSKLIKSYKDRVFSIFQQKAFIDIFAHEKSTIITRRKLDFYFRKELRNDIHNLLNIIYELDALKALASAANHNDYTFPEFIDSSNILQIKDLYHPFVKNAVSNDIYLNPNKNICFLTGPNMAGKSTLMKSFGLAVYLAHCCFPIPASEMRLSLFKGLFTTINLSDNLSLGYSHYFSEVARVKDIALRLKEQPNLVIIFDELFKGTNVKDAYDGTLAVINALSHIRSSSFLISTHIIEVANKIQSLAGINFKCFQTEMVQGTPQYTYKLNEGVSKERIGMLILEREGVLDILDEIRDCQ